MNFRHDMILIGTVILLTAIAFFLSGCASPKVHMVYVGYGEKAVIFVPSKTKGKWVNFEVEAPDYEEVE